MKPFRNGMVDSLVLATGLHKGMTMWRPVPATVEQLVRFHDPGYIDTLRTVTPDEVEERKDELFQIGLGGSDTPVFEGIFNFSSLLAGASLACAYELNRGASDIAINWSGGMHHGLRGMASGFCPVNDVVLAIQELLSRNARVLYVDIDVHHGDGVEKAFYGTNRVFSLSYHKYDKVFFPGTGHINDVGHGEGTGYALNVPLRDGMDDESFTEIFKSSVDSVLAKYRPEVIVMQCGADSLAGDTVGLWNLTTKGHGACVAHIRRKNLPLMLLGGGGYNLTNVGRCWTYETAIACGNEVPDYIPFHNYWAHYDSDEYKWHTTALPMKNDNTKDFLDQLVVAIQNKIAEVPIAPSVPIQGSNVEPMSTN